MLNAMMTKLETDLRAASEASMTHLLATARTQLEKAIAEIGKERANGLAEVEEQQVKAAAYAETLDEYRAELQCEIDKMQAHMERQEGRRVELNVGGYRYETSVQTLRRVPGNLFDTYFSGRYPQTVDGSTSSTATACSSGTCYSTCARAWCRWWSRRRAREQAYCGG